MRSIACLFVVLLLVSCGGGDWDCEENTTATTADHESAQWRMRCAAN